MSTAGGAAATRAPKSAETREQKSWYWYDWANSAYVTTTATVLFAPYLTSVATAAACPDLADGQRCAATLSVLGIPVSPSRSVTDQPSSAVAGPSFVGVSV
jgi:MFS-type transporter involved in bile tolerance (Atg22 family)